jgi:hypothetical protein
VCVCVCASAYACAHTRAYLLCISPGAARIQQLCHNMLPTMFQAAWLELSSKAQSVMIKL